MDTLRVADEVHVISDLHLGGVAGFQIFREQTALSQYIRRELCKDDQKRRWLIINGDFVDFLAEGPSRHFDPAGAIAKLDRIAAKDGMFADVFAALTEFLDQPANHLGITVGNHDVELALPWVREKLVSILVMERQERGAKLELALDGQGILIRVGSKAGPQVLCVHGNEVDPWNVVDHEDIRKYGRDGVRGHLLTERYIPNAGSRIVVEVMNDIKREFPFVDLLKPEAGAVVPILIALRPSFAQKLADIAAFAGRQVYDRGRIALKLLGDEMIVHQTRSESARPQQQLLTSLGATRRATEQMALELLDRTESKLSSDTSPADLLPSDMRGDYLGLVGMGWNLIRGDIVEALRQNLDSLYDDRSFIYEDHDTTYRDLHERVSTNVEFLFAGHTHLPRAIERELNRAYYFNTGTWARVFRIDDAFRVDKARFRELFVNLRANTIDALDGVNGLVRQLPHVGVVWQDDGRTYAELRTVTSRPAYNVEPVLGTRFPRT